MTPAGVFWALYVLAATIFVGALLWEVASIRLIRLVHRRRSR